MKYYREQVSEDNRPSMYPTGLANGWVEVDGEVLARCLRDSLDSLLHIYNSIVIPDIDPDAVSMRVQYRPGRDNDPIVIKRAVEYIVDDTTQAEGLAVLSTAMECDKLALNHVTADEPLSGTVYIEHLPWAHTPPPKQWSVVTKFHNIRFSEVAMCARCGTLRLISDMQYHKLHPECDIVHSRKKAESDGLVKVSDMAVFLAARTAGVCSRAIPTYYDTYVPQWVADAVKLFKDNTADGDGNEEGFGGMSLAEFLRKMRPD